MAEKKRQYTFEFRLEVVGNGSQVQVKNATGKFHYKRGSGTPVVKIAVPGTLKLSAEGIVFEPTPNSTATVLGVDKCVDESARTPSSDLQARLRKSTKIPKATGYNFPIRHDSATPGS